MTDQRLQLLLAPPSSAGDRIYSKWTGGFWRFISAAELGASVEDPRMARLADAVLDWAISTREEPPDSPGEGRFERRRPWLMI
jgi:hypothetical protein